MRHLRKGRKLGRTASHRKALLASLTTSLFRHKKISTTVAKAKEARVLAEHLITKAKRAVLEERGKEQKDVHARREVARYIKDREVVGMLFGEIAPKVSERPGGYTRVVKLGQRLGDAAQMAVLELVDYNVAQEKSAVSGKGKEKPGRGKQERKKGEKVEKEEVVKEVEAEAVAEETKEGNQ